MSIVVRPLFDCYANLSNLIAFLDVKKKDTEILTIQSFSCVSSQSASTS